MAEQHSKDSTEENKPAEQPNIEVGDIHVGGCIGRNFIVGQNITINSEQQVFRSLYQLPQLARRSATYAGIEQSRICNLFVIENACG